MLQQSKSKTIAKFKYLLLIPGIGGILTYTSCKNETSKPTSDQKKSVYNDFESACINQNSKYYKNLDNFLKVKVGTNTEVIVNLVNIETSDIIRTAYIPRETTHHIRHIPEGTYRLDVIYGENYTEEIVDGKCKGFFKKEKTSENGEDILDYHTAKTEQGINVPSYTLSLDLLPEGSKDYLGYTPKNNNNTSDGDEEPTCPNKNAKYEKKLDNYLKLQGGSSADAIVNIVSLETKESIRTVFIGKNKTYLARHIPEGKYQLHISYGDIYSEKSVNGVCTAYFKNEKFKEINENILNFNTIRNEKGINVPSFKLTLDVLDENNKS